VDLHAPARAPAGDRRRCVLRRDLATEGLGRDRVLAASARLLDRGMFRIGSEAYAEQHRSYGLATLLKDHVTLNGTRVHFSFPAKSGQQRDQIVDDPLVLPVVRALKRRRGGSNELLAFREDHEWADVTSNEINGYLKAVTGDDFSARDFRTWNGTVIAAALLAGDVPDTKTARRRRVNEAVKGVAFFLGNTPAVSRASYIDPRVVDRFHSGWTIAVDLRIDEDPVRPGPQTAAHRARGDRSHLRPAGLAAGRAALGVFAAGWRGYRNRHDAVRIRAVR
jgi:DNA topoisomerase-1